MKTNKESSGEENEGLDKESIAAHEEATKVKTISYIRLGKYKVNTWYYTPLPTGYHNIGTLFFCEFCLNFMVNEQQFKIHMMNCQLNSPPGNEIYKDSEKNLSVFEIDANKDKTYCENLGYISKMFLDHKLLYYNLNPFLFYVLTENDKLGCHICGYFSKNRNQIDQFNLSCILVLPFF